MSAVQSLLASLRNSRAFFWKHADRFQGGAWDRRIGPGTKTARETLQHLFTDDRAALLSLNTGEEADYEALAPDESDPEKLKAMLLASHNELLEALAARSDELSINVWGNEKPILEGIAWYASEDFYHAGQLAMILLALDPDWAYYPDIYGE